MEPKTLYHYCSLDTFLKIIKKPQLKLSDVTKSNDDFEIKYLWEEYIKFCRRTYCNGNRPTGLEYEIQKQNSSTDYLSISFSENRDSSVMWNRYAYNGICLGFNYNRLNELSNRLVVLNNCIGYSEINDKKWADLKKVEYFEDKNLNKLFDNIIKDSGQPIELAITNSFNEIFKQAQYTKRIHWKEESEWRLSIPLLYNGGFDFSDTTYSYVAQRLEMAISANNNHPACTSVFVPFDVNIIENITLSPCSKISLSDLKKILCVSNIQHIHDDNLFKSNQSTNLIKVIQ